MVSTDSRDCESIQILIQTKQKHRHFSMDAGIQSQGCETMICTIIIYNNNKVTIRGTGFWHSCQNDVD
jgi:hypothetical protein